jgi:undecaprenyl-diphosphatase
MKTILQTMMRGTLDWLGRRQPSTLVLAGLLAGGLCLFVELTSQVLAGETRALDRAILLAMRSPGDPSDPIGPAWFEELMRDFTALGGVGWMTFLTLGTVGYLALRHRIASAAYVALAVLGGSVLSMSLKIVFDRPRPDLVPHASYVSSASFPSGHSTIAVVAYLTLAALAVPRACSRCLRSYLYLLAAVLIVLVGVSRVYLGVHWPTDVLAGWTLGALWAACCWFGAHWLLRRGSPPGDGRRGLS